MKGLPHSLLVLCDVLLAPSLCEAEPFKPEDCTGCEWKEEPDGGHCYMFREPPKTRCAQRRPTWAKRLNAAGLNAANLLPLIAEQAASGRGTIDEIVDRSVQAARSAKALAEEERAQLAVYRDFPGVEIKAPPRSEMPWTPPERRRSKRGQRSKERRWKR